MEATEDDFSNAFGSETINDATAPSGPPNKIVFSDDFSENSTERRSDNDYDDAQSESNEPLEDNVSAQGETPDETQEDDFGDFSDAVGAAKEDNHVNQTEEMDFGDFEAVESERIPNGPASSEPTAEKDSPLHEADILETKDGGWHSENVEAHLDSENLSKDQSALNSTEISQAQDATDDRIENGEDFGAFDGAHESEPTSAALQAGHEDDFGAFDADAALQGGGNESFGGFDEAQLGDPASASAMPQDSDEDDEIGTFDDVQPSEQGSAAPPQVDHADDFGDFGEPVSIEPSDTVQQSEEDNGIGDFGEAQYREPASKIPQDDELGAFDEAQSNEPASVTPQAGEEDEFGTFDEVKPSEQNSTVPQSDQDDDFGDFDEALPSEQVTTVPQDDQDDDFGDFDEAQVTQPQEGEEDDEFGDFDAAELTPIGSEIKRDARERQEEQQQSQLQADHSFPVGADAIIEKWKRTFSKYDVKSLSENSVIDWRDPEPLKTLEGLIETDTPPTGDSSLFSLTRFAIEKKETEAEKASPRVVLDINGHFVGSVSRKFKRTPRTSQLELRDVPATVNEAKAVVPSSPPRHEPQRETRPEPASSATVVELPPMKDPKEAPKGSEEAFDAADDFLERIPDLSYMLSSKLELPAANKD